MNYVFQGEEVELTGRTAERKKVTRRGQFEDITEKLVEIKPVETVGSTWTKWVNISELYEIKEN